MLNSTTRFTPSVQPTHDIPRTKIPLILVNGAIKFLSNVLYVCAPTPAPRHAKLGVLAFPACLEEALLVVLTRGPVDLSNALGFFPGSPPADASCQPRTTSGLSVLEDVK